MVKETVKAMVTAKPAVVAHQFERASFETTPH
jgi:hypothetical protein